MMSTDPTAVPQFGYNDRIPIDIRRGGIAGEPDAYSVKFAGIEIGMHLLAGGIKIEFTDDPAVVPSQPTITLTFSPDATELNLDATLIGYLRALDAQAQKPVIVNHAAGCKDKTRCPGCR